MRERGEGDFRGARVSRAAAAGRERAAAGGRSGCEGRQAAGGGEGRAGPAARATCGAGWLPLSAGGGTQFPRGSSGARGLARTQAGIHTRQSARSSLLQPRPGRPSCCSFPEPRVEGKAEPLCPRERQVSAGPFGYQAQQTAPPHRVSQSLSL